jgi:hypothetical protein
MCHARLPPPCTIKSIAVSRSWPHMRPVGLSQRQAAALGERTAACSVRCARLGNTFQVQRLLCSARGWHVPACAGLQQRCALLSCVGLTGWKHVLLEVLDCRNYAGGPPAVDAAELLLCWQLEAGGGRLRRFATVTGSSRQWRAVRGRGAWWVGREVRQ